MFEYMYIYIYVYMYTCLFTLLHMNIYMHINIHIHLCIYVNTCMYLYIYTQNCPGKSSAAYFVYVVYDVFECDEKTCILNVHTGRSFNKFLHSKATSFCAHVYKRFRSTLGAETHSDYNALLQQTTTNKSGI